MNLKILKFVVTFLLLFNFQEISAEEKSLEKPRIGILTSGGDCSGLNAIIYSAVRRAEQLGYQVVGFKYGVHGIIKEEYETISTDNIDRDMLSKCGTILHASTKVLTDKNGRQISTDEGDQKVIETYHKLNLNGLIYIGGDGSTKVMKKLTDKDPSLNIVSIPKTIDNDISNTDQAVGFSTAVKVATSAIEKIIDTAKSHSRIMVIEVMGRAAGYIALYAGLAVGADAILLPEFEVNLDSLKKHITDIKNKKNYAIVIVSEAVSFKDHEYTTQQLSDTISRTYYKGVAEYIKNYLKTDFPDTRSCVLGHIQIGGKTSFEDRIIATQFGNEAINCIHKNDTNVLLGIQNGKTIKTKLKDIKQTTRKLHNDDPMIKLAIDQGIFVNH